MKENDAPFEITLEVLKRLDRSAILQEMVLVGSWCVHFYKDYFPQEVTLPPLRTRDIDFLVDLPPKFSKKVDVPELLKDLGFVVDFSPNGHMRLGHPELIIDFLVPEKGRGGDKPYPLASLGMKAQPLRFLSLLTEETILVKSSGIDLRLPHPKRFALHKLIISQRRENKDKIPRDREQAVSILRVLVGQGEIVNLRSLLHSLPTKWGKMIFKSLTEAGAGDLATALAK